MSLYPPSQHVSSEFLLIPQSAATKGTFGRKGGQLSGGRMGGGASDDELDTQEGVGSE